MLAHGGAPDLATTPQVPGASGASLSLNQWVGEQSRSCPKRPVSSSRVLRFVPAAQPASSFLLVIAVLVLIGGTFAGLAPDDGRGVFPSAHATEDSAQRAVASPEASVDFVQPVIPDDCSVDSRPVGQIWVLNDDPGAQIEREYGPVFLADTPLSIDIANAARVWQACSAHGYPSQRQAMESPRFIYESGGSDFLNWDIDGAEEWQIAIQLLADEVLDGDWTPYYVGTALLGDIDAGTGVYTPRDERSFLLPQHVYQLPDGRFGGLVTKLVPLGYVESMSVSPDHHVEFQIYAQDPTQDGRWVLDETLWLCATGCDILAGKSTLDTFGATPVTIHIPQ